MGQRLLSLKGDGVVWRGKSNLTVNDRGQRRLLKLENAYVSRDGGEIRSFPGYATLVDLTEVNNPDQGYSRYVPDSVRPILSDIPGTPNNFPKQYTPTECQTLYARAKPAHLFGFEQLGGELFIVGESRFREVPTYSVNRNVPSPNTPASVSVVGGKWVITMALTAYTPNGYDLVAGATRGQNGVEIEHPVYLEGLTSSDATEQAALDAELNGRIHLISSFSGAAITLTSSASWGGSAITLTAGDFHLVRYNRNNNYPTPVGTQLTPYEASLVKRIDDPDGLTVWRVIQKPSILDKASILAECWPAWVANRQRDWGDLAGNALPPHMVEGIVMSNPVGLYKHAVSRREGLRLPYRPGLEPALDRLIVAAPQYGCMFQIPAKVAIDPSLWPSPGGYSDTGIVFPCNNIYDKPRALGIPKARIVDSERFTPTRPTPDAGRLGLYSMHVMPRVGDSASPDSSSWPAGTYKVAITYFDSGTGEEGLASEPVTVVVPAQSTVAPFPVGIVITYMHPGYVMPECLADRVNVYITGPDGEVLAFYGSFSMEAWNQNFPSNGSVSTASAVYGTTFRDPTDKQALFCRNHLPIPSYGSPDGVRNRSKLAPQSNTMPRGASACKFIRGVLFAGGAMGNSGPHDQLWRAKASSRWIDSTPNVQTFNDDEIRIRTHALQSALYPPTPFGGDPMVDGTPGQTTLGVAGRCFPDAYQGIEVLTGELAPGPQSAKLIEKVLNRDAYSSRNYEDSPNGFVSYHHEERLRLTERLWDASRVFGDTPNSDVVNKLGKDIYYVMPRGQLQVGDPGAPNRSSRAFIKIVDPSKGDDITAIGQVQGTAIVCTRRETYSHSWYRNPASEEPNLMSNEFGCVAPNSMVEFDGGLAWISDRGPVALGQGLQFVGEDVHEDFAGSQRRYEFDSKGMMRHTWGCHDAQRGLVMWGLITKSNGTVVYDENQLFVWETADDKLRSRFPCDEVLIWSYRTGAFSTWRPPQGLEILWMRPITDADGETRVAFLAADKRIYVLDDDYSDSNNVQASTRMTATASGTGVTVELTGQATFEDGDASGFRNLSLHLREGMLVELLNSDGDVVDEAVISSITQTSAAIYGTTTIVVSAPMTWVKGQSFRIGGRQRMTIISSYIGAETGPDNMQVQSIQMRYMVGKNASQGVIGAAARVKAYKPEFDGFATDERTVYFTTPGMWKSIASTQADGDTLTGVKLGRRIRFSQGIVDAEEVAVSVEITGESQVRIQDIGLEV